MPVPANPKIYHIVHVDKLASIVADGMLCADSVMAARPANGTVIGMNSIKQRRLGLPVGCHDGLAVGACVPFYFCPRSIMLYVIAQANHVDLAYRGGQAPIVHLEADLHQVVAWAAANNRRWAFSLSNAGAVYAQYRAQLDQMGELNWNAIAASDFRPADIKEAKQAEFLIEQTFPWHLVERIGVISQDVAQRTSNAMLNAAHRPAIVITRNWYY
jgi:ssDNA thymidine ADP-ribosyltransferase, DarT